MTQESPVLDRTNELIEELATLGHLPQSAPVGSAWPNTVYLSRDECAGRTRCPRFPILLRPMTLHTQCSPKAPAK